MGKLEELREQHDKAIKTAGDILARVDTEERELTKEEISKVDEYQLQAEKLGTEIEREERQVKLEESRKVVKVPVNLGVDRAVVTDVIDNRAKKPFKTFGDQLQAVMLAAIQPDRTDVRLLEQRATGASEGVPSDGGFLVQQDFSAELLKNVFDVGLLASRVRRIPISGNSNGLKINAIDETSRIDGSRWGGIRAYWADEAASLTKSKPKFRQMNLTLNKLIGLVYATDELLQDTIALEAVIRQGFQEEFAFKLDDAIYQGDGVGKPSGILSANATVSISKETGQVANTIVYENISKMYSRLWSRSGANAVWYINQDVLPELFNLVIPVGTGGVPVYQPANQAAGAPYQTLFGRPIVVIEHAATLGTTGDIFYADLSQYLVIEKGGVQSASSIHVQFTTDETTFRFVMRVDGQPVWNSALTPYKGTNTVSPFIKLNTRS